MRAVSLVCHFLVVALVFTHSVLYSTLDVVLRHVLTLADSDDRTQCRVVLWFWASCLYCYCDLFAQTCECLCHVAPTLHLGGLTVFKCSSHVYSLYVLLFFSFFLVSDLVFRELLISTQHRAVSLCC